jgi:hypothetical protein
MKPDFFYFFLLRPITHFIFLMTTERDGVGSSSIFDGDGI